MNGSLYRALLTLGLRINAVTLAASICVLTAGAAWSETVSDYWKSLALWVAFQSMAMLAALTFASVLDEEHPKPDDD